MSMPQVVEVLHFHVCMAQVFAEVSDLVQSSLDGYHVCLAAYGQTGEVCVGVCVWGGGAECFDPCLFPIHVSRYSHLCVCTDSCHGEAPTAVFLVYRCLAPGVSHPQASARRAPCWVHRSQASIISSFLLRISARCLYTTSQRQDVHHVGSIALKHPLPHLSYYASVHVACTPPGSGKTYTMLGGEGDAQRGIIPRALDKVCAFLMHA